VVVTGSTGKLSDWTEPAIMLVRKLVAARRRWGIPGAAAITDVAPELGISPWRVETLFYRYRMCLMRPVLLAEWDRLRERGAALLRAEAVRLRRLADELDAEADYLESRQSTSGASQCAPAPGVAASLEVAE
jgi:hypothetical protein